MSESRISFKFPLVDLKGTPIASDSLLGSVGFSQKYSGVTSDEDQLVRAVRSSLAGEKVDVEQAALLRSFMADWLTGRNRKLSDAVSYSVELRQCISFLSQVGFLDRTVTYAGHAALGVATLALTWDCFVSEGFGIESLSKVAPVEVAAIGLPLKFEAEINKRFGEPGSSVSRASFDLKPILMFLQCCHMRMVIDDVEGDESLIKSLTRILDWQTFSLFMLNSRQLEGLSCSGSSEATAAVAAHAAIALGLRDVRCRKRILAMLAEQISSIECSVRRQEAGNTLDAIRKHGELNTRAIERQLNRQLVSSATTEALDLAVTPLRASLQLMSLVAGGMESVTPGHYGKAFGLLKQGCDAANSAATSTPDVLATALDSGISAETWARQQFDRVCGFLVPRSETEASS